MKNCFHDIFALKKTTYILFHNGTDRQSGNSDVYYGFNSSLCQPFNAWCPLKGHTYLKKFKYVWPFSGHQALNIKWSRIVTGKQHLQRKFKYTWKIWIPKFSKSMYEPVFLWGTVLNWFIRKCSVSSKQSVAHFLFLVFNDVTSALSWSGLLFSLYLGCNGLTQCAPVFQIRFFVFGENYQHSWKNHLSFSMVLIS